VLEAPPVGQRLIALGGYLAFASMLLLVIFAGFRLFARPEAPDRSGAKVIITRDADCLPLTSASFHEVERGNALWGFYAPADERAPTLVAPEALEAELENADLFRQAVAVLRDPSSSPADIDTARAQLEEALAPYIDLEAALAAWSAADSSPLPLASEGGIPTAWAVDDPFRICTQEVTNDQYFEFLLAWARKSGQRVPRYLVPPHWTRRTGNPAVPNIYDQHRGDFPVRNIAFDAALEFCGWFWEEHLNADPDLVVDLPTWREFILAARGENLDHNFPWGRSAAQATGVNLQGGQPWKVLPEERRQNGAAYGSLRDMVGNVAEWVYYDERRDPTGSAARPAVAGWSYEHGPITEKTVFGREGFRLVARAEDLRDVGFRPVIRHAPALPSFVRVTPGKVRHLAPPRGLLPPERPYSRLREDQSPREDPIRFLQPESLVTQAFEIAATETTNRQYLYYLAAIAPERSREELRAFLPLTWDRTNRLDRRMGTGEDAPQVARAFLGYYLGSEQLPRRYEPGQENLPVRGVSLDQAEAYAHWLSERLGRDCALPTVAQYLRAARGDRRSPYPWGTSATDRELVSRDRPDHDPDNMRPFSLAGRLGAEPDRILGLAGNVAEYVLDEQSGRWLLAGGFYELPAALCTLDSFLDATWSTVQYETPSLDEEGHVITDEVGKPLKDTSSSIQPAWYAGFRVVSVPTP